MGTAEPFGEGGSSQTRFFIHEDVSMDGTLFSFFLCPIPLCARAATRTSLAPTPSAKPAPTPPARPHATMPGPAATAPTSTSPSTSLS